MVLLKTRLKKQYWFVHFGGFVRTQKGDYISKPWASLVYLDTL